MKYIEQPKGPGTAYRFRMKTPKGLLGTPNPWSQGKPFGTWIIRPMEGERHLPTAKKIRDMFLAEVRKLEITYRARQRYSPEKAEMWAEALRDGHDNESFIRSLIYDEAEKAPVSEREAFLKIATSDTLPLSRATPQYLKARAPDNPYGNKPLTHSTSNEVKTAVNYLCAFFERTPDTLFLDDVTPDKATEFWHEFLPTRPSKKNPSSGLSPDTVAKLISGLRNLWKWAIARKKVKLDTNPFKPPEDDVPRAKKPRAPKRDPFKPNEARKVLSAVPQGHRMGDLFRIGLVTGARVSEIAKVTVAETVEDGSLFLIAGGKTDNAKRVVPVPTIATPIIRRLRQDAVDAGKDRLFHAFPINAATGTAKSASKAFTDLRRKVLGRESDDRLAFHSLRHTWKTLSRRAGLSIDDAHDLGGWAGVKRSSDPYDHGLNTVELAAAQEKVAALLLEEKYLEGF